MKHKLTFPFESLTGTDSSGPKRTYYMHKDCQVSRAYNPPKAPYNTSFNAGRVTNDTILKAYKLLTPAEAALWVTFCNQWNTYLPMGSKWMNVWTSFCTVNFYRVLMGFEILTVPPTAYPSKRLDSCEVKTIPGEPAAGRFDALVSNFPTENAYCVFWLTTPQSNFLHAYRKPESRLSSGFSPLSVAIIDDTSTPFQFLVDNLSYQITPGQFFYVDTRLITAEGFPMPVRRFEVQSEEAGLLISVGTSWQWFFPATFSAGKYNEKDDWVADYQKQWVYSDLHNILFRLPVLLLPGSIIDGLSVSWRATPSEAVSLSISLDNLLILAEHPLWTSSNFILYTWNGAGEDPQYDSTIFTPITLSDLYNYSIALNLETATKYCEVLRIGIRTTKRIY
jgi:hypothetical protein